MTDTRTTTKPAKKPTEVTITFAVNRQQFKHQLQALQQQYKTEFMAE